MGIFKEFPDLTYKKHYGGYIRELSKKSDYSFYLYAFEKNPHSEKKLIGKLKGKQRIFLVFTSQSIHKCLPTKVYKNDIFYNFNLWVSTDLKF